MKLVTRRHLVAVAVAGVVGLFGATACDMPDRSTAPADDSQAQTSDLNWDAQALETIGFEPADLAPAAAVIAEPTPAATSKASPRADGAKNKRRHRLVRFAFGRGALHGEAVVTTEDGTKTVVAQRGEVTAIDAKSITVKSTDGFTLTWVLGTPITVVERRSQIQPSAIAVGTKVGVAGEKTGTSTTARLVVVPKKP